MRVHNHIAKAAAVALLIAPGIAAAQQPSTPAAPPGGGAAGQPSGEMQSVVKEYRQVASELQEIRKKAVEQNPDLKEQREAFQDKVETAMTDEGYEVESRRDRVQEIGEELRGGDVEQERKQKLIQELQSEQQKMREAQQTAMQKPEVQAAGQELQDDTLSAMREENSKTDQLLDEMTELRGKLQSMQQQQQQQQPAPPTDG